MANPISLDEIRKRAVAFAAEWRHELGHEKQQAHQFVADLLLVFGITKRKAALYEKRAQRSSTGRDGYIDALLPGLCIIEMKSRGEDLATAEQQALDYMGALPEIEMPRWVVTCNFSTIRILDLTPTNAGHEIEQFDLNDLPKRYRSLGFLAGYQKRDFGSKEQEKASIKAARLMADLYEGLDLSGHEDHVASVFLVRTLFCLYADDSGAWERDSFRDYLENRTNPDGSDLGAQLTVLYQQLDKPQAKRPTNLDPMVLAFPYVNGDLFAEQVNIPSFDSEMRAKLVEACSFNWSSISPAIFGSLFQAVKDKVARRELGEHYTTETNILKTIDPLFMDELRARFTENAYNVAGLKRLRGDLSNIRVLDPACGCGNFLIVAYRELRALDLKILERLQELGDRTLIPAIFFTKDNLSVTLDHFAGIELEEWPARIATAALHLVDHQANQAMELALGTAPDPLPLDKVNSIHVANALHIDWATVMPPTPDVRIVGNPPFSGARVMGLVQKADMARIWGPSAGDLDYVTAWHKKAIDYFDGIPGGRFALVSTNSITQGNPVPTLFRPIFEAGWRIRFAHQTFAWTSEAPKAAAVHCVITGFDKHERAPAVLYKYSDLRGQPTAVPATLINAYLVDASNVLVPKRTRTPLSRSLPEVRFGSMPNDGGHLIVEASDYGAVVADPVAARYLRRYVMGEELIHNIPRWCLWLKDLDPADLTKSPLLRERINRVRDERGKSKRAATREKALTPHLFAEDRQPTTPYLGIPRIFSESRQWATCEWLEPDVIAGDSVFTAPDPDGFAFAIISSSMFITWQKTVGGRLKSDPRFSTTPVWNNLPLPNVLPALRPRIILAGQVLRSIRASHPQRSLADHYNPLAMDPALVAAHAALDRVVDKAFGARRPLTTVADRQAVLFTCFAAMASGEVLPSTL